MRHHVNRHQVRRGHRRLHVGVHLLLAHQRHDVLRPQDVLEVNHADLLRIGRSLGPRERPCARPHYIRGQPQQPVRRRSAHYDHEPAPSGLSHR